MKFKDPKIEAELAKAPTLLKLVAEEFELLSRRFGKEPTMTRVLEPVEGESGVHQDYRAFDIRDEYEGRFSYSFEEKEALINYINARFPRNDGKKTCIWHSFNNGPHHFHLQVAAQTKTHC